MKRSPLKRGTSQLKRTELKRGDSKLKRSEIIKKKSKGRSSYDAEFERMKPLVHARSKGRCEAGQFAHIHWHTHEGVVGDTQAWIDFLEDTNGMCAGVAHHTHHRKYRSRGGTNSLDNLIDVCIVHHDWIHAHGKFGGKANLLGLALSADESEEI